MKRLHVSINVSDLERSIQFYSALFATAPSAKRDDYAQWMLDDPRVNFVVELAKDDYGLTHAGIQVEDDAELAEMFDRMQNADAPYIPEGETTCCYHRSEKSWTEDPDGLAWEAFLTHNETRERGTGTPAPVGDAVCCEVCG